MLRIAVRIPGTPERVHESSEARVAIGRSPGNDLTLDNPHVSSHHARIDLTRDGAVFTDLGSTNGSMIQRGNHKIPVAAGGAAARIEVGDVLVLGDSSAPVTLVLLDDSTGGGTHPLLEPLVTAISEAPVDPNASGAVAARAAIDLGPTLPRALLDHPQATQVVTEVSQTFAGDRLETVVDAVAHGVFALCPAASHVYIALSPRFEPGRERVFTRQRAPVGGQAPGRPSRVLIARTVMAREAWLVTNSYLEAEPGVDKSVRVPSALCVPLLTDDRVQGVLQVDARDEGAPLTEGDLAIAVVLARLLTIGYLARLRPPAAQE
ncbi:MAG: FHA domain-containing protein [Deltaproteobacteria bacterium]|nr:FHA domain-containing protein [Deltaproteobacteria bacterium]